MDFTFVYSTAFLFVLLMDPFGNLPIFIATLRNIPQRRYPKVILRESCLALGAMVIALMIGRPFLKLMHIAPGTVGIAGGLILLLMGIKMVYPNAPAAEKEQSAMEPFFVPLAIPLICGPGTIAFLVTIRDSNPTATFSNSLAALIVAWLVQTVILLCGSRIALLCGNKMLNALESLFGLLLACIAVGLIINGINDIYGIQIK